MRISEKGEPPGAPGRSGAEPVRRFAIAVLFALGIVSGGAQTFLFHQSAVVWSTNKFGTNFQRGVNYSSFRGVPIFNTASGADGRAPIGQFPTTNQFQGLISHGAIASPTNSVALHADEDFSQNAKVIGHPVGEKDGQVVFILRSAQVATPSFSRPVEFLFGDVIPPPEKDENGDLITGTTAADYWFAEPHSTPAQGEVAHAGLAYYWSPHAQSVFATQPGPVEITWRKKVPVPFDADSPPVGVEGVDWFRESGFVYRLKNSQYVVSGSPSKKPKSIYWTEGPFRGIGKPINVPNARVSAVNIIYSSAFPSTVPEAERYVSVGENSPADGSTNSVLRELRTLWYDSLQGQIFAYNKTGRVFVELLGDTVGAGQRQFLGFEIVNVYRTVTPVTISADLGEKIAPNADGTSDPDLSPSPVQTEVSTQPFLYAQPVIGSERTDYYAAKETANLNDVLVHWLEPGVEGLRWPALFTRYRLVWPADVAKYSHYVRPLVSTETEAARTAVQLPAENVPAIQYQDSLDRPRAKLTEDYGFYCVLDSVYPAHRTLLRFQSGERVAFERVFSWLDQNLKSPSVESTVATNLTSVVNYLSRGHGEWKLFVSDAGGFDAGSIGSWTLRLVSSDPTTQSVTTNEFVSQGAVISIPTEAGQASPFPSSITVGGLSGRLTRIEATLNSFSHSYPGDLTVILESPQGVRITLMGQVHTGLSAAVQQTLVFKDDASSSLSAGVDRVTGVYRPTLGQQLGQAVFTSPFPSGVDAPRVISEPAVVGNRIDPPDQDAKELAGYILQSEGTAFNVGAYRDPFVNGIEAAKLGAIIPVNATPGENNLDIWWFRAHRTNAVKNQNNGFAPIYWPSVIGRYSLQWPTQSDEIVLASNDGSGGLESLEAAGTIYTQNDPLLPGYNPNEEHALMLGGQAFALRDDLNVTSGQCYSSEPFVLLDFVASDGRPKMRAFKVLREKPTEGLVFDYVVEAGSKLQAPMPLPLLPAPLETVTNTLNAGTATEVKEFYTTNHNAEPLELLGDLPAGWSSLSEAEQRAHANYQKFTYKDRKDEFWVLRGLHAGLPELAAGRYEQGTFATSLSAVGVVGQAFTNIFHVSRPTDSLVMALTAGALPPGLSIDGVKLQGVPTVGSGGPQTLAFSITDTSDQASVSFTLTIEIISAGSVDTQGALTVVSTNQYAGNHATFVGRAPFLASPADPTNAFSMRFYYLSQEGFAWPGISAPPAVGSIVPYLTRAETLDRHSKTSPALDIVYRPVWPSDPPTMQFGQTLLGPSAGLPAVRGQTSVELLYQQSIARAITNANQQSVVLHDPTSAKSFPFTTNGLAKIPAGVLTENYQGKTYFPNLPPHLAKRFYFDPNVGAHGSLVFTGDFVDEVLGADYLLLNVLRGSDLHAVLELCPASDADKSDWDGAVNGLTSTVVTKYENPQVPGQWIDNPTLTRQIGIGDLIELTESETAVNSYALSAGGPGQGYVTFVVGDSGNPDQTPAGESVSMYVLRVEGSLYPGELKIIPNENPLSEFSSFQHSPDLAGRFDEFEYEWKMAPPVDGFPPAVDPTMSAYQPLVIGPDLPRYILGGSSIQTLVDNYIVLRYRPLNPDHPLHNQWSQWTTPQLAEGWIKRVLAGINPFNQRVTDLFNNAVNTDANILTSAGARYEGDIALNLDSINEYGLIEIYETVLKRGRGLSIDAGINFGPANDALLLAAGYINDLYMLVGNEAFADAANPTIGIGTKDSTYGDIATSLFAFKGQLPSVLSEELALLRGRDDVFQPGVETSPVYNRLVWNFTRGIDSGEVIYALNYNILDQDNDGAVGAGDAAHLFPQGHGDAYGHYLTANKGYYSLLMNNDFDWVPRVEAVTILGKPVSVDYVDERKFATAAAALARTGRQIFDLTWRQDYQPGEARGWEHLATNRVSRRVAVQGTATNRIVREWGADQWASRTMQGTFFNWVVGNAILPAEDPDPTHEGIQKIDRTTVPELQDLVTTAVGLQTASDNAEGRLNPLGLAEGSLAFDINPNQVVGAAGQTHFEQVYARAKNALNNAVISFDDAKDVTRLLRSEQDSLADFQTTVAAQEHAYTSTLIELYGTPYTDDIGTGKTYAQGYAGPDLLHYTYVETPEREFGSNFDFTQKTFQIDVQTLPDDWIGTVYTNFSFYQTNGAKDYATNSVTYHIGANGLFSKPEGWTGRRVSPGKIQDAISRRIAAQNKLRTGLATAVSAKSSLDKALNFFRAKRAISETVLGHENAIVDQLQIVEQKNSSILTEDRQFQAALDSLATGRDVIAESLPKDTVFGLANGGDFSFPGRAIAYGAFAVGEIALNAAAAREFSKTINAIIEAQEELARLTILASGEQLELEIKEAVLVLGDQLSAYQDSLVAINELARTYTDADRGYRAAIAKGDRLQAERESYRQRAAAVIQGFRTRDAAFRIFRNEKLERYKTLFDLASQYSYLAATAYDYETGLLDTDEGRAFVNRIVSARALGMVRDGEPQFGGSNSGDPGLSSVLAEMKADWEVLKGRLGFNNPDAYGTTVSLRQEAWRFLAGEEGKVNWQDKLVLASKENLLDDADVRRHCLQIADDDGLPVPGLVIEFSTTIENGRNLFGQTLAGGDHKFSPSSFATKIFAAGVAFEGYQGMDDPTVNNGATGGNSTSDPATDFLNLNNLSATPYIYLIPVGVDSMRSPPLGDASSIRSWTVNDVAIPLPFNIGASDFSTKALYQSSDSLTEPLFAVRKHQAFRPVSQTSVFGTDLYGGGGTLNQSQFTNNRLIGRSVWNSRWKLVIPGRELLGDPDEGIERFIRTVNDIKLHFVTYSYSGN